MLNGKTDQSENGHAAPPLPQDFDKAKTKRTRKPRKASFLQRRAIRVLIIISMFFAAFCLRMPYISSPGQEYYPFRQYFSAWGARCMYERSLDSTDDWKQEIVEAYPEPNSRLMVPLPTIEGIAFLLYRLAGGEALWLPRLFSALSYLAGGALLYLLARKILASIQAALLATGFYLFLPVAVLASRSLQSDPLMVAAMIGSIYAIVLHHEKATWRRAAAAGGFAALAITIRPVCAFMIFGAFTALALKRQGLRSNIKNSQSWFFAITAVLPMVLLMAYDHFFISQQGQTLLEATFQPQLLLHGSFYGGWAFYALGVLGSWFVPLFVFSGILVLVAAIIGSFMFRGYGRALASGLWFGYVVCCLVYTYHISNHHYFHLQLVPLVALCLGPVTLWALIQFHDLIESMFSQRWLARVAISAALLLFVLVVLAQGANMIESGHKDDQQLVTRSEAIGELVNHSPNVVLLSAGSDVAWAESYYGWFLAYQWPRSSFLGEDIATRGEALFHTLSQSRPLDYFVVTDLTELERQEDLNDFLTATFPIIQRTDEFVVFRLRNMPQS